ncbi:hypothetical protein ONE63_007795 [Megalurothrips usitatus]|uniref:Uncharacterized protein n=1 Tax=Megalurothrips usitatus TaxID=439358 RepID=A0AAV7XPW3_9NEOP|nr:hypothetical protein ONE63_007795 [Megalurothrips usitatus]
MRCTLITALLALLALLAVAAAGNSAEAPPATTSPAPAGREAGDAAPPPHASVLAYEQAVRLEKTLDLLKDKFGLLYRSVKPLADADLHVSRANNSDRLGHRRGLPWLEVLTEIDRVIHILGGLGELVQPVVAEEEEAIARHGLGALPDIVAGPAAVPEPLPIVLPSSYYRVFLPGLQQSPAPGLGAVPAVPAVPVGARLYGQPQVVGAPVYPQVVRAAPAQYPSYTVGFGAPGYPQVLRAAQYPHAVETPVPVYPPHAARAAVEYPQYPHAVETPVPVYPQHAARAAVAEYPQHHVLRAAAFTPIPVGAPVHQHTAPSYTYVPSY